MPVVEPAVRRSIGQPAVPRAIGQPVRKPAQRSEQERGGGWVEPRATDTSERVMAGTGRWMRRRRPAEAAERAAVAVWSWWRWSLPPATEYEAVSHSGV